ncbi:MAG: hypothetical protein MZV64_20065 [Ignavibacteriales bacterium]|nr:hypothetical protein [Ignavibacteriales bacterium]
MQILLHHFSKTEGDLIYVLGEDYEELGGSEYLKVIHKKVDGEFSSD